MRARRQNIFLIVKRLLAPNPATAYAQALWAMPLERDYKE
jgi:hypothetical protein